MTRTKQQRSHVLGADCYMLYKCIANHACHKRIFGLGDLDLWPMTLTLELGLYTFSLDLHAKIQVGMFVGLARIVRLTDTQTDRETMPKLLWFRYLQPWPTCQNSSRYVCWFGQDSETDRHTDRQRDNAKTTQKKVRVLIKTRKRRISATDNKAT